MTDKQATIKAIESEIVATMERLRQVENVPNRVFYLLHEAINTAIRELQWEDEHAQVKAEFEELKKDPLIIEQRKPSSDDKHD